MLTVILGIIGAAAGRGLIAIAKTPKQADAALQEETLLVSRMELCRATAYDSLTVGTAVTSLSDPTNNVYVDVALADPSGGSSPNANYKKVTVRNANSGLSIVTFVNKP